MALEFRNSDDDTTILCKFYLIRHFLGIVFLLLLAPSAVVACYAMYSNGIYRLGYIVNGYRYCHLILLQMLSQRVNEYLLLNRNARVNERKRKRRPNKVDFIVIKLSMEHTMKLRIELLKMKRQNKYTKKGENDTEIKRQFSS